jgi:expansin (peptidoglycan-binding protein)
VNSGGFATFFYQNGNPGACGNYHSDYDLIAAIDIDRYGDTGSVSSLCGQTVQITNTNNGNSVTVVIADACPSCANSNSIDLSVGAFQAIASLSDGEVPIVWSFT